MKPKTIAGLCIALILLSGIVLGGNDGFNDHYDKLNEEKGPGDEDEGSENGGNGNSQAEEPNKDTESSSTDSELGRPQTNNEKETYYNTYHTKSDDGVKVLSEFGTHTHVVSYDGGDKTYTVECTGALKRSSGCKFDGDEPDDGDEAKEMLDAAADAEDNDKDMIDEAKDKGDIDPEKLRKNKAEGRSRMAQKGEGVIKNIIGSWTNELFGEYLKAVPSELPPCDGSLYREKEEESETDAGSIFDGLMADEYDYGSQVERDILDDTRTVILSGEKAQLEDDLYRYAVNMQLIGGPDGGNWTVFLYNSCTGETSKEDFEESDGSRGWMDYGKISYKEYVAMHYAGGGSGSGGEDMIFDCSSENCRFNKVCLFYKDEETKSEELDELDDYKREEADEEDVKKGNLMSGESVDSSEKKASALSCVTLSHGSGFYTEGETESTEC